MCWCCLFISCIHWRGTLRQTIVNLTNSIFCAAVCFLYSVIPQCVCYYGLQSFCRTLISEFQRAFTVDKNFYHLEVFYGRLYFWTSNKYFKNLSLSCSYTHPKVTVLGAVGFKVILKSLSLLIHRRVSMQFHTHYTVKQPPIAECNLWRRFTHL